MNAIELRPGIHWVGAIDWDRRVFDELFAIPAGTTYNAYLIQGRDRSALVDTVDPAFADTLLGNLEHLGISKLDYLISNHAEQDHSGALPALLARYPQAQLLTTYTAKGLLADLLHVSEERITTVSDGERLALGGRTLRFIHLPWVHWPETMLTYLEEEHLLCSGDLFGSHLAPRQPWSWDDARAPVELKRYYACIMMPYREVIARNLPQLRELPLDVIAPSHGPVLGAPMEVLETYQRWTSAEPLNLAVLPYVSMHESTRQIILHLARALEARGVEVELFNLADPDTGKLASALVEAATLVLGAPTVLGGAHPLAAHAAFLVNALRPKLRFATVVGSYGWSTLVGDQLAGLLGDLNVELLPPVLIKGRPRAADLAVVEQLAEVVARGHVTLGATPLADAGELAGERVGDAPDEPSTGEADLRSYRCKRCGWVYRPSDGDPRHHIAPGTPFAALPDEHWFCPFCGVSKRRFQPLD